MKCDLCKTNEATIRVRMHVNGTSASANLCSECFTRVQSGSPSPIGGGLSGGPFGGAFSDFPFPTAMFGSPNQGFGQTVKAPPQQGGQGFLDQFGRNLTQVARTHGIDPVIGRDVEVHRVIEILNRRNKNNPVLIGEPGVGKTAIAEGLALRIVEGNVPAKLRNKQVYTLDVASLVADTGIRGQFEERMKNLLAELESRPDVILFIDEIHLLVGAGSAQGSMDAGNILKPALARGDLQVIGATTLKEYRQIEKDAALERRFQPVMVNEPSVDEAIQILRGLRQKYEEYHQVKFSDDVIALCVTLSNRYISDRFLPDKAIDLMDEAGSKVNLRAVDSDQEDVTVRLERVIRDKEQAIKAEEYERAGQLHEEEMRLRQLRKDALAQGKVVAAEVTVEDIQSIVEEKTGIPVRKIQSAEQSRLRDLEEELAKHVVGQRQAISTVARAVRRSRAGLRKGERPIGSFLMIGPTGVGKTELAKSLALALFGSKDSMIRLDMSEYMEKHSISKLIGSPPGYVGYDEAGQLTEQVRRNPYSLILLDEIEKAHPDVLNMFLQIMEDGRLTDSQGRTVSFKDTLIIMTSNAGVSHRKASLGFAVAEEQAGVETETSTNLAELSHYFKPEFLNRLDAVVDFHALSKEDIRQIVTLFLEDLKETMETQGIALRWNADVVDELGRRGYHPAFGARPLRRVIQDSVEDKIADLLVEHPDCKDVELVKTADETKESGGIAVRAAQGVA